ncbi:MAG: hypothetical protein ACK2T3_05700, partial [Candidatus Promineifilaceae bacterium]
MLLAAALLTLFGALLFAAADSEAGEIGWYWNDSASSLNWSPLPVVQDPSVRMPGTQPEQGVLLLGPGDCLGCHSDYDPVVEPGSNWQGSMMAQAGRDFLYWATLTVAAQDAIWAVGNPNASEGDHLSPSRQNNLVPPKRDSPSSPSGEDCQPHQGQEQEHPGDWSSGGQGRAGVQRRGVDDQGETEHRCCPHP